MKIRRVDTKRCRVGEGPVWDVAEQALYFLDIAGRQVHRFDPNTGETRSWETPTSVGSMALRQRGGAVVALTDGFYGLDLSDGELSLLAARDGTPGRTVVNDGKVDRRGRFVVGLCATGFEDPQPIGGVASLGADHALRMLDTGVTFSNGPCWSPDDSTFYFSDSHVAAIFAYDYDIESGELSGKRLFADTSALGGQPDGTTVDRDGLVWSAIFRGGKIVAFRPDGKVERVVDMPVQMAVSVSFGGPDLDQLYVTTIDPAFFGEPPEDGAGEVYVIEGLGARGVAEPRYAG